MAGTVPSPACPVVPQATWDCVNEWIDRVRAPPMAPAEMFCEWISAGLKNLAVEMRQMLQAVPRARSPVRPQAARPRAPSAQACS
eukprot:6573622-Prymnesium_polylepis.1